MDNHSQSVLFLLTCQIRIMLLSSAIGLRDSVQYRQFWITAWVSVLMVLPPAAATADATANKDAVYAPYVVAVLKKTILSCTGFLLSRQYVGVGCHCIADLEKPGRPRLNAMKLIDYDFVAGETVPSMLHGIHANTRKPRAVLTHPYCENEPPKVFDVGIAVMEEPFHTIHDKIEVYDLLRTNSLKFVTTSSEMFSRKRPQDAPNCAYAGWKISDNPEKNQLMAVEMISFPIIECKKLWREEDPANIQESFNFDYPVQFCLVTRNETEDGIDLPDDGPLVCDRLLVGFVSYGPERRQQTRRVPVVTQSLAILLDWIQYDAYFESIGCFGNGSDCREENDEEIREEKSEEESVATKTTMGLGIIILSLVHTLSLHVN